MRRRGAEGGMKGRGALILLAILLAAACAPSPPVPVERRLDVVDVLGGDDVDGFARALEPRELIFPRDHGPHPAFAAEWWYFTGNVESEDGRRFGYQLTFFRTALRPPDLVSVRPSAWASSEVWMAHFAVTDIDAARFVAFDRFQRGALGLAGARDAPWRVWLDDWSLEQSGPAPFPLRLRARHRTAAEGDGGELVAIDLTLDNLKPLVLQGERGLSRKGPTPGNASYYYSLTRLSAEGTLGIDGVEHDVVGTSWLDREWSSSALEPGQVGWDWFALQLDDGNDLMYYQMREADGGASPESAGTLVFGDGTSVALGPGEVRLGVESTWNSPRDATIYPAGWTLSIPGRELELRITPVLADQELNVAFRYWEGAVEVLGTGPDGVGVSGRGYVELTGYAGSGSPP